MFSTKLSVSNNSSLTESVKLSVPVSKSHPPSQDYRLRKWRQTKDMDLLNTNERILKHLIDFSKYLAQAKKEFFNKFNDQPKKMNELRMDEFQFYKTLGKGTFGRVVLAVHIPDSLDCAIKLLEKAQIIKHKQTVHVRNEIGLLSAVNFPFITEVLFTFKSSVYICIGMPFFNGGDMFGQLRRKGRFDEQESQFYAAQVILAFEYIHFLGIVYRDLKPENIMYSSNGYIKLVDFGFAKKIDGGRTYTLCGTPDYLAPEILIGKGYGRSVDWWSFGVLVYEMACGQPPFYNPHILKTYDNICRGRICYPLHFSKSLRNFLENIIQVDTTKRYGFLKNGIIDIKCHEWFQHFPWSELFNQTIKPFYKPPTLSPDYIHDSDLDKANPIRDTEKFEYVDEFKDF